MFCLAVAALVPAVSRAEAPADEWEWRVTLYGWFPAIDGTTDFPTSGTDPSFQVDASSIIEYLKFTAMGTFEGRKGRWGGWADVMFVNVGGDKSGSRDFTIGGSEVPGNVDVNASLASRIMERRTTFRM